MMPRPPTALNMNVLCKRRQKAENHSMSVARRQPLLYTNEHKTHIGTNSDPTPPRKCLENTTAKLRYTIRRLDALPSSRASLYHTEELSLKFLRSLLPRISDAVQPCFPRPCPFKAERVSRVPAQWVGSLVSIYIHT